MSIKFLSLFSGIGGFDLGLERAGMECVGQVEIDKKCRLVLEKHWPNVKRMGDIRDVKGNEFGAVDLICGGFPCQPFSTAGKRKGEADNRYLWPEMVRVIAAVRPTWVIGENVAGIVSMALDKVHSDLESIGYTVQSFIIPACAVGAPHRRDRVWIVAHSESQRSRRKSKEVCREERRQVNELFPNTINTDSNVTNSINEGCIRRSGGSDTDSNGIQESEQTGSKSRSATARCNENVANTKSQQAQSAEPGRFYSESGFPNWGAEWPKVATSLCGVDDGIPGRVDRLKQLGNAVVPQIVEEIGKHILYIEQERLEI